MSHKEKKPIQPNDEVAEQTKTTAEEIKGGPVAETAEATLEAAKESSPLEAELVKTKEQLLRTAAEYENYRKRTDREKQQSISYGCGTAVERMLPVLDSLEMAAAADSTDAEYKKGVLLTVELFKKALTNIGVDEVDCLGKPFDPEIHNAVMREQREGTESGTITAVLQKGYKLGDRVLRHPMVSVAE